MGEGHISREERLKQVRLVMNDSGDLTTLEAGVGCRSELLIVDPPPRPKITSAWARSGPFSRTPRLGLGLGHGDLTGPAICWALGGLAGASHSHAPGRPSSRQPPSVLSRWPRAQANEIVQFGRAVFGVVELAMVAFEAEGVATARSRTDTVTHDERHVDAVGNDPGALGHRLYVEALFDQVLEPASRAARWRRRPRRGRCPLSRRGLVTFGGAAAQRLGVDDDQGARRQRARTGDRGHKAALRPGPEPPSGPPPSPSSSPSTPSPSPAHRNPPLIKSMKASRRWASKESPPSPAAFQRRLASASRRGSIRANSTSSQKNPPLTPPPSACPQRKWRSVWTRARRSRSSSRLRLLARILVAASEKLRGAMPLDRAT